jgi:16S rRNA (cytidine1402-2'-O)-methyltransferase
VAQAHREVIARWSALVALRAWRRRRRDFLFHGYCRVKAAHHCRHLVGESRYRYAQLFIETPYRNAALLAALVATCRSATRLCVAVDLTLDTESVASRSIGEWRGRDFAAYAKRPAMFVLQV